MALLTDGSPNTVETLKAFESSIADVAAIELIDVDIKMGLAIEEISESLMVYLIQLGTQDPQYLSRRRLGMSTVVITAPLRRWRRLCSIPTSKAALMRSPTQAFPRGCTRTSGPWWKAALRAACVSWITRRDRTTRGSLSDLP